MIIDRKTWRVVKPGQYTALFIRRERWDKGTLTLAERKAQYIILIGPGEVHVRNSAFILGGITYVKKATAVALGGEVYASDGAVVCPVIPGVKIHCDDTVSVVTPKIVETQSDWDKIPPGVFRIIVIKGRKEKILLSEQKADYIVQLFGDIKINTGVTIFSIGGSIECCGGTVIAYSYPIEDSSYEFPPLYVKLCGGESHQYGGVLEVNAGRFQAPYLKKLKLTSPNFEGEVERVKELKDFSKSGKLIVG